MCHVGFSLNSHLALHCSFEIWFSLFDRPLHPIVRTKPLWIDSVNKKNAEWIFTNSHFTIVMRSCSRPHHFTMNLSYELNCLDCVALEIYAWPRTVWIVKFQKRWCFQWFNGTEPIRRKNSIYCIHTHTL